MHEIVGADAVIDGRAKTISASACSAVPGCRSGSTKPLGDLTARLTMPFFCPILPGTPIDPAGIDNPAGSGPYYVAEWVVNRRIVLERNPFYRGDRPANVDQIIWTVGQSDEACFERRSRTGSTTAAIASWTVPLSPGPRSTASTGGRDSSSSTRRSRRPTSPSTTRGPPSEAPGRSHSRRRSTTRSTDRRSSEHSAIS